MRAGRFGPFGGERTLLTIRSGGVTCGGRCSGHNAEVGEIGVVEVRSATIDVSSDLADLAPARAAIVERVAGWAAPVDPDVLALLVGEVVANAVEHGAPPIQVCVDWDGSRVRVEVHDGGTALPVHHQPVAGDDGGRGIWLVDHEAGTWGVSEETSGKSVWFELGC